MAGVCNAAAASCRQRRDHQRCPAAQDNLQLRLTMRDDLEDLKLDFESFKLGMQRLLKSKKLEQLLEAILAIGNYMNGTVCNPSSP